VKTAEHTEPYGHATAFGVRRFIAAFDRGCPVMARRGNAATKGALTLSLSHPMGEGGVSPGEGFESLVQFAGFSEIAQCVSANQNKSAGELAHSKRYRAISLAVGLASAFLISPCLAQTAKSEGRVQITKLADRVRVEINGQLFTEYHYKGAPKPYCYPVIGPTGAGMTRDWPIKDTPGEQHDHPHHRGFWFGHGVVNSSDLWTDSNPKTGKIVHNDFIEIKSGTKSGEFKARNNWLDAAGKTLCTDEQTMRFYHPGGAPERMFDFDITIHASNGDVLLGDTKEGMLAFRIAETMRLTKMTPKGEKPIPGDGHIVNSEGVRDAGAWGKRAAWVDYSGPVNSNIVGIAIFDHPSNLRHPTWWHARDYGLLAANPFGRHDFEGAPEGAGNYTIPAGKSLTLRYRIYLHEGDEKQGKVAERYKEYVQSSTGFAKQ
jgi:hypothetical protein